MTGDLEDASVDDGNARGPDPFRLDDHVAVVTGASGGIGAHCAQVLHDAGARIVLVARRHGRLEQLAATLDHAHVVAIDLAEPGAAQHVVDVAIERFGRLDVLVNAAGVTSSIPASKETPEALSRVVDVNLVAPYALAWAALDPLKVRGGSIVNITSVMARVSDPSLPEAGYIAAKGGLATLTRELAVQWARYGVRVNAIAPGWFPTEMIEALTTDADRSSEFLRRRVPFGRFGILHELDGPLLLLASSAGSYITGQTLGVDGGASLL